MPDHAQGGVKKEFFQLLVRDIFNEVQHAAPVYLPMIF